MIFAGIYKNELSVINVFPSIQCFCLNISEMNRIESTSYSVLITRGISRYVRSNVIKALTLTLFRWVSGEMPALQNAASGFFSTTVTINQKKIIIFI